MLTIEKNRKKDTPPPQFCLKNKQTKNPQKVLHKSAREIKTYYIIIYWGHAFCFSLNKRMTELQAAHKTYIACGGLIQPRVLGTSPLPGAEFLLFTGLGPLGGKNKVICATFPPAW